MKRNKHTTMHHQCRMAVAVLTHHLRPVFEGTGASWPGVISGELLPKMTHQLLRIQKSNNGHRVQLSEHHMQAAPQTVRADIIFALVAQGLNKILRFDPDGMELAVLSRCPLPPFSAAPANDTEASARRKLVADAQARFATASIDRAAAPRAAVELAVSLLCASNPMYACVGIAEEFPKGLPIRLSMHHTPPLMLFSARFLREVYEERSRTIPLVCGEAPRTERECLFRLALYGVDAVLRSVYGIHALARLGVTAGYKGGITASSLDMSPSAWGLLDASHEARHLFLADNASEQGKEDLDRAWRRAVARAAALVRPHGGELARAVPLGAELFDCDGGDPVLWSVRIDGEGAVIVRASRSAVEGSYYVSGGRPLWSVGGHPIHNKIDFLWHTALVAVARTLQVCTGCDFPALLGLRRPFFEPAPLGHQSLPLVDSVAPPEPHESDLREELAGLLARCENSDEVNTKQLREQLEVRFGQSLGHLKPQIKAAALDLFERRHQSSEPRRCECGEAIPPERAHAHRLGCHLTQSALARAADISRLRGKAAEDMGVYGSDRFEALLWSGMCVLSRRRREAALPSVRCEAVAPSARRPLFHLVHAESGAESVAELPDGCPSIEALCRLTHPEPELSLSWAPVSLARAVELRERIAARSGGRWAPAPSAETDRKTLPQKKRRLDGSSSDLGTLRQRCSCVWALLGEEAPAALKRAFEEVLLPMLARLHPSLWSGSLEEVEMSEEGAIDDLRSFCFQMYDAMEDDRVHRAARKAFRSLAQEIQRLHPVMRQKKRHKSGAADVARPRALGATAEGAVEEAHVTGDGPALGDPAAPPVDAQHVQPRLEALGGAAL